MESSRGLTKTTMPAVLEGLWVAGPVLVTHPRCTNEVGVFIERVEMEVTCRKRQSLTCLRCGWRQGLRSLGNFTGTTQVPQRSNSDPGVASPTMQPRLHAPPKNPLWQGLGQSSRPAVAMSSAFNARCHPCLTAGCCEIRRGANTSSAARPTACGGLSMLLVERSKETGLDRHPKWQTGLQDRRELTT